MKSEKGKTVILPSGNEMPLNGFGTWKASEEESKIVVKAALEAGYRHIDCAAVYWNEVAVGEGLKEFMNKSGTNRSEIFITSKVWNTCHAKDDVVKACKQSISDLGVDYLDLYLVHHPFAWEFQGLPIDESSWVGRTDTGDIKWAKGVSLENTWRGMEECLELGLVKDIGVSNYAVTPLMDLLMYCKTKPAVNQCEGHVYNTRKELRKVCDDFGVHFTMYSVLGSGKQGPLQDETVKKLAESKGVSAAQILLAWGLHQNCSVLGKSSKPKRAKENFECEKINLNDEEIKLLDGLNRNQLTCNMVEYWGFASHA